MYHTKSRYSECQAMLKMIPEGKDFKVFDIKAQIVLVSCLHGDFQQMQQIIEILKPVETSDEAENCDYFRMHALLGAGYLINGQFDEAKAAFKRSLIFAKRIQ